MTEKNESASKNPIQVVDRVFKLIETMSSTGPIGLMELSNLVGLHKSTTYRLLNSLMYMNYVKQDKDTSKYCLTYKLLEVSHRGLQNTDIFESAHHYLKRLSFETGETVHLVALDGYDAVYIDKVESTANSVRMGSKVGSKIPLYCSGVGKALLSTRSNSDILEIWNKSDIKKLTKHTITDFESFMDEINEIRTNGYALDNEENEEEVRCIAAAITDFSGSAKYAFSLSAPLSRMSDERIKELVPYVLGFKKQLSLEFGYSK